MPTYQFKHKETDEISEVFMKISELDSYKAEHPELEMFIGSPPKVCDPTRMSDTKISKGDPVFQREIIGRMKASIPQNTLNDRKFQIPREW